MNHPYNDEYLIFDKMSGQYVLTERYAAERLGLQLRETVNDRAFAGAEGAVNAVLLRVSNIIYNYIHGYSVRNAEQDKILACVPSARKIIQKAMGEQLLYMNFNGDLSMSTDKEKRAMRISPDAEAVLMETIPEIGRCILYSGV